jgi:predicted NBD/HSP70 family sugar kinase
MANNINEINTSLVLQKLWFSKGISRVDISRELGMGKSTVTKIVKSLLKRNLVKAVRGGRSGPSGGRTPTHLMINSQYGHVLGLEIQTDFYKAVAINLLGEVIFSDSEPIGFADDIVSTFSRVMTSLKEKTSRISLPLIGVGVGVAGIIDIAQGVIEQSNPLNVSEQVRFYDEVKSLLDVPVLIENDANCCCWGELAFRKTERHENFVFVLGELRKGQTVGTEYWGIAVGLGFVLNGKVHYGEGFSAGEFQSILWKDDNHGQFSISDEDSRRITTDPKILAKAIDELSAHIAFLVNTLNLTSVVIGGEIAKYRHQIVTSLEDAIQQNWSYRNKVDCTIEFATLGDMAVAYGAAGMFLERFFSIPEVAEGPRMKTAQIGVLSPPIPSAFSRTSS